MNGSDVPEGVLADMRRRLDDDPDAAEIREAAAETDLATVRAGGSNADQSLEGVDVDALVTAYRETFVRGDAAEAPADHTEAPAIDSADTADHTEPPRSEGTDGEREAADAGRRWTSGWEEQHRINRVAHFRDSVRTAREWYETGDAVGPGVFDVASDAQTTEGMDAQLAALFEGVDYEVRSYTIGPDDRHPSWTQIRLRESVDPSRFPDDLTIRKVEDVP